MSKNMNIDPNPLKRQRNETTPMTDRIRTAGRLSQEPEPGSPTDNIQKVKSTKGPPRQPYTPSQQVPLPTMPPLLNLQNRNSNPQTPISNTTPLPPAFQTPAFLTPSEKTPTPQLSSTTPQTLPVPPNQENSTLQPMDTDKEPPKEQEPRSNIQKSAPTWAYRDTNESSEDEMDDGSSSEEEQPSLEERIAEQAKLAEEDDIDGEFYIETEAFEALTIPELEDGKSAVQWAIIPIEGLPDNMLHISSNSTDYMTPFFLTQCKRAKNGKEHRLNEFQKKTLVENGYKCLVKLFHNERISSKKKKKFVAHATRSVLDKANIPLDNLIALSSLKKRSYDWFIVSLTREAYAAFQGVRALFDVDRSRALVLLRPWTTRPQQYQTVAYSGLITQSDEKEGIKGINRAKSLFYRQLDPVLYKRCKAHIMDIREVKEKGKTYSHVYLQFDDNTKFITIDPERLPKAYNGPDGRREIEPLWPRRCQRCLSESHLEKTECPWTKYTLKGKRPSAENPAKLNPGQSENPKKRKFEDDDDEAPVMDLRPTRRHKKARTSNTEAVDKGQSKPEETATQPSDILMSDSQTSPSNPNMPATVNAPKAIEQNADTMEM